MNPETAALSKDPPLLYRGDHDGKRRNFLFLQGLSTPLFFKLGQSLVDEGNRVLRINICGGDYLFWRDATAISYCGRFSDWSRFLSRFLLAHEITDIVLFGDRRPYHRVAVALAARRGITVHSFDEGYLRPDWITMETGTKWREEITTGDLERWAKHLPSLRLHRRVAGGFAKRALWDVAFHAVNMATRPLFPFYVRHRPIHPVIEGLGWIRRASKRWLVHRAANRVQRDLLERNTDFYLLPLQLDSDFQLRHHSSFKSMGEVMHHVFSSFAAHAPANTNLLVKVHPLENGLVNRPRQMAAIAATYGVTSRVRLIDGGHLPTLIGASLGVVVVNSTTGLTAIHQRKPTFALANPIYKLPGLVSSGTLDNFWTSRESPWPELVAAFERVLADRCQINGSYFTAEGIDLAVRNIMLRLERNQNENTTATTLISGRATLP